MDMNVTEKCNCLPSCTSISYNVDATHSTTDNKLILKKLGYLSSTEMYEAKFVKNIY